MIFLIRISKPALAFVGECLPVLKVSFQRGNKLESGRPLVGMYTFVWN